MRRRTEFDACSYFYCNNNKILFRYVHRRMRSTTGVPPIFPPTLPEDQWDAVVTARVALFGITRREAIGIIHDQQLDEGTDKNMGTIQETRSINPGKQWEFLKPIDIYFDQYDGCPGILSLLSNYVLRCTSKLHDRLQECRDVYNAMKSAGGDGAQYDSEIAFSVFHMYHARIRQVNRATHTNLPETPTIRDVLRTLMLGLSDIRVPLFDD